MRGAFRGAKWQLCYFAPQILIFLRQPKVQKGRLFLHIHPIESIFAPKIYKVQKYPKALFATKQNFEKLQRLF